MLEACKQNMMVIKTTAFFLKIEIKKNLLICGLTFHFMQSLKTVYQQKEKLTLHVLVTYMLDQSQIIWLIILACKFQEVFGQCLSGHIFRGNQQNGLKIGVVSLSIDPLCVPNYKEIRRGHVN